MKKIILISLCVLFVGRATAFAASYSVSGKVYYKDSGLTVNMPSVTLTKTCSGQSAGGGCASDHLGNYSGGWTDCGSCGCVGSQMTLRATKGNYAGSVTWVAQSGSETKDIYISSTVAINPDIGCGTQPSHFVTPDVQTANLACAYDNTGSGTIEVTGFTAQLAFDSSKMMCYGVQPSSNFPQGFGFFIGPDTVEAWGNIPPANSPVILGDVNNPTELFSVGWNVLEFDSASLTSVILDDANSEFTTPAGPNRPVFNRTDYVIGEPTCKPTLNIETAEDWENALLDGHVRPMDPCGWTNYMYDWQNYLEEGEPYPAVDFNVSQLYVYEGNGSGGLEPNDAGLVMRWGDQNLADGDYASGWTFDYNLDPDLRNSIIRITVTAPQFGATGQQVTAVSFGINDNLGLRRHWWWQVGNPPAPIQWNTPTTVTIDTSKIGVNATTPIATGYMNMLGFNLAQAQSFDVDENFQWVFGQVPVPPPGQPTFVGMWNYWHNLLVTKKNPSATAKYFVKWSQRPKVLDPNDDPPVFWGWDEKSDYNSPPILADDWKCTDDRPVTDIHWWGSFIGWNQPYPPPILPQVFHLGIWTDVPDPNPAEPSVYSHPNEMVWENYCDNWVWNFAGYDWDPHKGDPDPCEHNEYSETCFQFNQLLSEDEWFQQEEPNDPNGTVYWLSIAPIYNPNDYADPNFYPWGWKTREHFFNDDAVRIMGTFNPINGTVWPPTPPKIGAKWTSGNPIYWPDPCNSWDLAFELTTNKPAYADDPIPGDLNADEVIDFLDIAILANNWLVSAP
ncbi:MAG: hypothetical protein JSV82_05450 [Planctomycetota bacterium]|nr:MAG: hypothetical protein JSV82_05450 [Planctomycetota bacterium]